MKYNKLVRDKIIELYKKEDEEQIWHIATNDQEYWEKLKEKLREETEEFLADESQEELADIEEVLDAIYTYKQYAKAEVKEIQKKKRLVRGGFRKRIILDEVEKIPNNH